MLTSPENLLERLESGRSSLAVIGLGYVGLPLAVHFSRHFPTVGFDVNPARVEQLRQGRDHTREVSAEELASARLLRVTAEESELSDCDVFIVTVPTPIDQARRPDLGPLLSASRLVGRHLRPGSIVIYESTVYPGATEEDCVPVLEAASGLRYQADGDPDPEDEALVFYCGYSPERINPGDTSHRLPDIMKITSGSTPAAAGFVDRLYKTIVRAGTYPAESIRVAEAAKVIENIQRDLNIALVNELAILFARMGLDTARVLAAAGTKWNFLPFKPGLVGGHCIGVDPYYLTHKAQSIGYHPQVILAGRRVNDSMGFFVAGQVVRLMARSRVYGPSARVLVLGLSFKENCPDLRNTRAIDVVHELQKYSLDVDVHDPWVDADAARDEYGLDLVEQPANGHYAAVIVAVAHQVFVDRQHSLRDHLVPDGVLYDARSTLAPELVDGRL
ncbi:nucleotide sugar dehydrogenase [Wenzhouxiangella sediminis]|jgi:UDP-N-acetyl-D-galactosamine dehydrogenase|uniref:Nucleotide sugar dehydrogenase n=1 Tax=Wenzhouxiangella sediminis TaxID=1792836 RepID=A0A3E1KAU9_9GAMM|nr:nucleotide sugar dehydrogenase [Wenzhouxiangella sediminis]RFF31576.1 nucleotide sugar dehydrogenase [Wenzhouxiangella sediminis]